MVEEMAKEVNLRPAYVWRSTGTFENKGIYDQPLNLVTGLAGNLTALNGQV